MIAVQAAETAKKEAAKKAGEEYVSKVNAFAPLSKAHAVNLKNAIKSMKDGISPVIFDNTNITKSEAKPVIVAALRLGYADCNIKIVDVGTGGLDAKGLAERNTHGVPLDKIEKMMKAHKSVGELTLKGILAAKDRYKQSDVSYSGVILDQASKNLILECFGIWVPNGWTVITHHMTINLGPLKDKTDIGKEVTLTVVGLGLSDMAIAAKVEGYPSKNTIPHITIAINPEGGSAKMSNNITKWKDVKHFFVNGVVTEIGYNVKK